MVYYEEDIDNFCEGCGVRNTGDNFHGPAFCRACMSSMMDMPHENVLEGKDKLTQALLDNQENKVGALNTWKDTDGAEVEIMLPLPAGTSKTDLVVKVSVTKLIVRVGERKLLFVDPLYDNVRPDDTVWCLEQGPDGNPLMQLSLVKYHPGTRWGKTLCQEGGVFECWKNQLLPERPAEAPASAATTAAKPKPRFTLRDDGDNVEVNLPLPPEVKGKKELSVRATATTLKVDAGSRSLLHVEPLFARIVADELAWTLEKAKDGQVHCQLQLVKADESVAWEATLAADGGTFTCWTAELD